MQLQGFKCIKHKGGIEGATEVFCKKGELNIFTKFTGKHLGQSFRPATLLKERLWRRCFPVNYVNFLRTPLYTEHLRTTAFGGMKKFFCFSLSKKITAFESSHWELLCKKGVLRCVFAWENEVFWTIQSQGTLTKLGALLKFCLLAWDVDVFWIIMWRKNSKQPGKIWYSCRYLRIFLR